MKPEGIQRPKILIIGNKPFVNLPLDSVVDHFEENCRCNISVPFKNNGTKFHFLYLCCHLYERLVQKSYSKDSFLNDSAYLPHYKQDYMASFYDAWTQYAPANIKHGNNRGIRFNAILQELGCPFYFQQAPSNRLCCNIRLFKQGLRGFCFAFQHYAGGSGLILCQGRQVRKRLSLKKRRAINTRMVAQKQPY